MNKKILGVMFGLLSMAAISSAAPVGCPGIPPALLADTVDAGNTVGGLSFSCGGLTFSNFLVTDAGNVAVGTQMFLSGATVDVATGIVELNFNPNLTNGSVVQDMHFSFTVTGGINYVDLTVFGSNSTISETACATPIVPINTGCTPALVPTIVGVSGGAQVTSQTFNSLTSPVTIFKDINRGIGGDLTSFNQSFHTPVPEPMTLSMMGLGLLGLGLVRRRQQGKK